MKNARGLGTIPAVLIIVCAGSLPCGCAATSRAVVSDALPKAIDVKIPTIDGRVPHLAGAMYLPPGPGPHPAVLLVQGSGPTDRNWNSPHIPGKVDTGRFLAERIAASGVAVLAFDKRGAGATPVDPAPGKLTPLEDVQTAFDYLRQRPDIVADRVGLVGHSEGAGLCLRTASEHKGVAALVMLCGGGRPGRVVLHEQITNDILAPAGITGEGAAANIRYFDDVMAAVFGDKAIPDPPPGVHADVVKLAQGLASKPGIRGCGPCGTKMDEDPTAHVRKLKVPLLIVGAGNDAHVNRADFDALTSAAPISVRVFVDDMDHMLKVEDRPPRGIEGSAILARYGEPRKVHPRLLGGVVRFLQVVLKVE